MWRLGQEDALEAEGGAGEARALGEGAVMSHYAKKDLRSRIGMHRSQFTKRATDGRRREFARRLSEARRTGRITKREAQLAVEMWG